jgi:HEAT repeat protein
MPASFTVGEKETDIEKMERWHEQDVSYAAAKALAKQGSDLGMKRVLEAVKEGLREGFPLGKVADLGEIGDKRAVPLLLEMLRAPHLPYDDGYYRTVAGALVKIGDERAVQPLINVVGGMKGQMRQIMIGIIGEWDHPAIRAMLMAELNGKEHLPMCAAAEALDTLGVKQGADKLLAVLAGGCAGWNGTNRDTLYRALGRMKEQRAIPDLIAAMETDTGCGHTIVDALESITGADLGYDPPAWKQWWEQSRHVSPGREQPGADGVRPHRSGDQLIVPLAAGLAVLTSTAAVLVRRRRRRA